MSNSEKELSGLSESEINKLQTELSDLSEIESSDDPLKGTLVDEFLMKQSREVQIHIRETLRITGISPNDPYFLMLLQARVTQVLLELTPSKIQEAFERSEEKLIERLDNFRTEFIAELNQLQTEKLDQLAKSPLSVNTAKKTIATTVLWKKLGVLSLCLVCSLGSSLVLNETAIAKARKQNLAKEDQATLKWAKSKEGQLARNIIGWNDDLVNGECKEKVKSLGLSFQLENTKTISGFCVLYVEPSNQRSTTTTD